MSLLPAEDIALVLWFLSAVLKHVQASGRSKDALSDQTQSVNSFTGPTTFPNTPRASALSAACTKPKTRTTTRIHGRYGNKLTLARSLPVALTTKKMNEESWVHSNEQQS